VSMISVIAPYNNEGVAPSYFLPERQKAADSMSVTNAVASNFYL